MTEIITADEAAKVLRVSKSAVQRMLQEGEIPAYREGRCWKIPYKLLLTTMEHKAIVEAQERKKLAEELAQ